MKRAIAFMTIIVAVAFLPASATIINIPDDYPTIQEGIDASADGDTVLVAEGHYYERINFYGKGILLTSEFMIDGDTMHVQNTIIDADTLVLGIADIGSVVCFDNGEDSSSVIKGFTLQNGIGTGSFPYTRMGGGFYCNSSSPTISNNMISGNSANSNGGGIYCYTSSPTINNNTITGNTAGDYGGGIYCYISSPTINNNTIIGNYADDGVGISCLYSSSPIISNNTISRNSADSDGGGITCAYNSSPDISNNTINENSADDGGGISCWESSPTISNNTINDNYADDGGGISCRYSSSPIISNNTINRNSADSVGGGIRYNNNSAPVISNNTIGENSADAGGGIYCGFSSGAISNNTISGNSADFDGGGIYCITSSPTIFDNTITGNTAGDDGGGIYCDNNSAPAVINNMINENSASGYGGGIACRHSSSPTIFDNTISGNSASGYGDGIYCGWESHPTVINSILWANGDEEIFLRPDASVLITYSDIQGGWEGEGNIDCDPMFCDPEIDNYFLAENSCCVGAGENGEDIGALGVGCEPTAVSEDQPLPFEYSLSQNYPNPFNAATIIKYELPKPTCVTIDIYNILGRKVETLMQGEQPAGYHHVVWDAEDHSSGMYFYRVQAGEYAETRKMVLLK